MTVTYTPPSAGSGPGSLVVTVGNQSLSASVNLDTLLALNNGNASVGFTAATGASVENHDITSWTLQAQVPPGETTVFQFNHNNYLVTPDADQEETATIQVTPILTTQDACNTLVQANPYFVTPLVPGQTAQCFVYKDVGGPGVDRSVMYEVICPPSSPGCTPFNAELGSTYDLSTSGTNNSGFNLDNPFPGWLKGEGDDPGHPCTPPASDFLFASNQISAFEPGISDPVTKGRSGGTASCWVATYNTPHEAPTVTITTPANGHNYQLGASVNADYTCTAATNPSDPSVGPYLTVDSCTGTVPPGSPN